MHIVCIDVIIHRYEKIVAIVMTLYHEQEVRRQDIFSQITTDIKLRPLNVTNRSFKPGLKVTQPHLKEDVSGKIKPDFRLRN